MLDHKDAKKSYHICLACIGVKVRMWECGHLAGHVVLIVATFSFADGRYGRFYLLGIVVVAWFHGLHGSGLAAACPQVSQDLQNLRVGREHGPIFVDEQRCCLVD